MTDMATIEYPYVEKNKSRHGAMRYYLRIDGKRICRLPDDINSQEFADIYWKARNASGKALARKGEPKPLSLTVKPNSFRWLCMTYMKGSAFTTLDQTTKTSADRSSNQCGSSR